MNKVISFTEGSVLQQYKTPKKRKFSCLTIFRKFFSLKIVLSIIFAVQIILPAVIILTTTVINTEKFVKQQVVMIAEQVRPRTVDFITGFMTTPISLTTRLARYFNNDLFATMEVPKTKEIQFLMLQQNPLVSYIYYATDENLFVGLRKPGHDGGLYRFEYGLQGTSCLYQVNMTTLTIESPEYYFPPNISDPNMDTFEYDVLTDPWYIETLVALSDAHIHWSEPYYILEDDFYSVMISAYYALYNTSDPERPLFGFTGADYFLSNIISFLQSLPLSTNSMVYVIESETDYMVAGSKRSDMYYNTTNEENIRMHMSESLIPEIAEIGRNIAHYQLQGPTIVQLQRKDYYLEILNFSDEYGISWKIVLILAVDDFREFSVSFRDTVIIVNVVVAVLSTLFGLIISIVITRPLTKLGNQMDKLRELSADTALVKPRGPLQFGFDEVSNLQDRFQKLQQAVVGFTKYVPVDIVKNLVNGEQADVLLKPFVESRVITILFSDIEGFTTLSEMLQPLVLVDMLSQYFEVTSSMINQHNGTVDKYIGDAIMALFNAPHDVQAHQVKACLAALAMQEVITHLNARFESSGHPPFKTRIGLNTGTALVGNCGSSARLNYTALGDNVNLASRLEGLNSEYGTRILISESTNKALQDKFVTRLVDLVAVKGKKTGVRVYELICTKAEATPQQTEFASKFTQVMNDYYFAQQFGTCMVHLQQLRSMAPEDQAISIMMKRCEIYEKDPPSDWDGVYVRMKK